MTDSQPVAVVCPTPDNLARFEAGVLPDDTFESIAEHITRCDPCLDRLAGLHADAPPDALVEQVRDCLVTSDLYPTATHAGTVQGAAVTGGGESAAAAEADAWVGRQVGRYFVRKRLGEGGMGVMFLAEDPAVGRPVALKMITGDAKPYRLDRFRTEGRALARVRHPNVVQFYHFDEHAGHPYFTMEFVPGASLADRLPDNPLPPREAAQLVRTVSLAVAAAHEQGIVHRDIKPSNILIAADGTPKVADFGLAKLADAVESEKTHTGMVLGTPSYMAPEQAEGRVREIDARTDVYALGAVLFAALTGRPPHVKKAARGANGSVTQTGVATPPARPRLPRPLARICEKCVETAPPRRYPTARALADDLGDWLDGRTPRGLPGPVARLMRPTRRQAVAAALGVFTVGAGVAAYRRSPGVVLAGIEADLRAGRAVPLVGESGQPRWSQWIVGRKEGETGAGRDGAFTLRAGGDVAMLELVPDPQSESYTLELQIRHDAADIREMSEVGLYVARRAHAVGATAANYFLQLTGNDIVAPGERRVFILPTGDAVPGPGASYAHLRPRLYGEPGAGALVDLDMAGATSPPVTPAGEAAGVWRTLVATVTPAGVACTWAGAPVAMTASAVGGSVAWALPRSTNPALQTLPLTFTPRGGVGLYVSWGTASFRSVTMTPHG